MTVESIRRWCLALGGVTEDIKWDDDLVFSVGGKCSAWPCSKCRIASRSSATRRPSPSSSSARASSRRVPRPGEVVSLESLDGPMEWPELERHLRPLVRAGEEGPDEEGAGRD